MSRKCWFWEANVLTSVWDASGLVGRIANADRFTSSFAAMVQQQIVEYLVRDYQSLFPKDLTAEEQQKTPVKVSFSLTIEKKEYTSYGK